MIFFIQIVGIISPLLFLALAVFVYLDMRKIQQRSSIKTYPGLYSLLVVIIAWILNYFLIYGTFGLLFGPLGSSIVYLANPYSLRIIAVIVALIFYLILRTIKKGKRQDSGIPGEIIGKKDSTLSVIGFVLSLLIGVSVMSGSFYHRGAFRQLLPGTPGSSQSEYEFLRMLEKGPPLRPVQ